MLVADAQVLYRKGVSVFLSGEGFEVREAEDGRGLVEGLRFRPHAVLLDARLPSEGGLEYADALRNTLGYEGGIVLLVQSPEEAKPVFLREAASVGANAVLPRSAGPEALREAVEAAIAGKRLDPPQVPSLSPREAEVLRLSAQGLMVKEIAARLGLGQETVWEHLERAYRKLGVARRNGRTKVLALERARALGLI